MTAPDPSPLLAAARLWFDAGYSVVPTHEDGSKRPFGPWKQYQHERPTWDQIEAWLASAKYTGIGVITGAVSGNVEMIELEGPNTIAAIGKLSAVADKYRDIAMDELLRKVLHGCVESSPRAGLHMFVKITGGPVPGNTKLAMDEAGKVLAETRGEGGFVVVAPTPARSGHEENTVYMFVGTSTPADTVTISADEVEALHYLFTEALHSHTEPLTPTSGTTTPPSNLEAQRPLQGDGLTPWDDFTTRTTWAQILEPMGWQAIFAAPDGRIHWTRPGKKASEGTSATTIETGPMYVFSTSTVLPANEGMSKMHVYTLLHHGGDHKAAARALAGDGYGEAMADTSLPSWVPEITVNAPREQSTPEDASFNEDVRREVRSQLVREYARDQIKELKLGEIAPLNATALSDFLAEPDDPVRYRVTDLWPSEGRVLLAAAAKSGKTTMVAANLIPCLVDGGRFLGKFDVEQITDGTVVLLNMEVGTNTLRRWMRDAGITNSKRVIVSNLRGKASSLALGTEQGRRRLAQWLADQQAGVVILDPLAPILASLGLDENDNSQVAQFFGWWSEALTMARVTDDLIVHHTGHAGQRSRGASRLLDEPDAIWTLGKESGDDDGEFAHFGPPPRFLSAYGRDVEMGARLLQFDDTTRHLTLTDEPRSAAKDHGIERKVIAVMSDGKARTKNEIARDTGGDRNKTYNVLLKMVDNEVLISTGEKRSGHPILALAVTP
jgi:hypothetical protein